MGIEKAATRKSDGSLTMYQICFLWNKDHQPTPKQISRKTLFGERILNVEKGERSICSPIKELITHILPSNNIEFDFTICR